MRFLEIIKSKLNKEKTQKAQTEEPQQNLLDADANLEQTEGVSRKAISIILIVAILLLAAVVYAIMTHGQKTEEEKEAEATEQTLQESVINATASSITDRFATGRTVVEIPEPLEPIKDDVKSEEKQITKTEINTDVAEPTNMPPNFNQVTKESQEEINRRKRIQQMRDQAFESALKSSISANVKRLEENNLNQDVSTNQGRSERQRALDYERERLNQRLQQVRSNSGTQVLTGAPTPSTNMAQMSQRATSQANVGVVANDPYASMASSGNWELGRSLEVPIDDPYLVRAGTVIPATLISGMNSQIPGQIIAQVSQNVYDSAVGDSLLIPQGTRLIGTYNSMNIGYGQERIMCAWQRLVYPDGKVLDLGSMPGTDQAGYSGFTDLVDNHWWELISSAFLMSGVTAGVAIATEDNDSSSNDDNDNSSINDEMRQALATQFGNVIAQVIQRNLNLAPTLEIRPGYKFNVMVTKDLRFSKPFEAFDYR